MTAEPPDDLTIPRPGSTSARRLLSATLQPLLAELGRKSAQASEPATRQGLTALLRAVREALAVDPGAVWSALRRPTVGVLIRCLRAAPRPELLIELCATLAAELAVAGVLVSPLRLPAPPRIVCLGARRSFVLGPGELRCAAGSVVHVDAQGRETPLWPAPEAAASHLEITPSLALALVDNNPLAQLEAHPDKSGNAIDLGGQSPTRWVTALREALGIIAGPMPELRAEIDVVLQQVVPVGYDEGRHLSASYQEAIGTVYLSLHPQAMTMAEAIIHEFSHNKLALLQEQGPLLENPFWPLYPSPVRPDPRPLHGVLLAVHAFLPVARLYELMLAGDDPRARSPEFRARFAAIVAGNSEGAEVLRRHARPTALGAPLLAEIARWDRHFAGGAA
jgi:HEXXH motif-containing protein